MCQLCLTIAGTVYQRDEVGLMHATMFGQMVMDAVWSERCAVVSPTDVTMVGQGALQALLFLIFMPGKHESA